MHTDKAVGQRVGQHRVGRNHAVHVLQGGVPCVLVAPSIDVVRSDQQPHAERREIGPDGEMLLSAQAHGRGKKPHQLSIPRQIRSYHDGMVDMPGVPVSRPSARLRP